MSACYFFLLVPLIKKIQRAVRSLCWGRNNPETSGLQMHTGLLLLLTVNGCVKMWKLPIFVVFRRFRTPPAGGRISLFVRVSTFIQPIPLLLLINLCGGHYLLRWKTSRQHDRMIGISSRLELTSSCWWVQSGRGQHLVCGGSEPCRRSRQPGSRKRQGQLASS